MPFITEELWNQIDKERGYIMISEYPLPENFDEVLNNDFKKVFLSKKRTMCAPPAPAHGLYLTKVIY